MINKFRKHIESNFSFVKGKRILLGLSGGLDSMMLAYLFKELNFDISLAHVNFTLRGKDSDEDENFVTQWAQECKLPLFKISFETEIIAKQNKISIEMSARDLRYNWFDDLSNNHNFDFIAVAHHLNDNVETVLMNLTRGTGISGVSGMQNVNGNIIRPLLPFSRKEIEIYAHEINLLWRDDLSNFDTIYKRNKIRHELIPIFEELNPSFLDSFSKNINNFKQTELIQNKYLETIDNSFWKEGDGVIEILIPKLIELTAFETVLREKLLPYNFRNIDDVISGLSSESGKEYFSATHRIIKDRDKLILEEIREQKEDVFYINGKNIELVYPLHIQIKQTDKFEDNSNVLIAQLDRAKLKFPLKLRKWEEGDFFYPQGMKGKKKLSKYFKDEKFSLIDKENQWLLVSEEEIVWVVGKRLDDRYKFTNSTESIFRIEVKI
jgi:tRNA(Ile)-lysidine synthase